MRPTFMGFETCKRGIMTNQKVLDIVGQNLTNWDTPGYTRQRVDLVSLATPSTSTRFGSIRTDIAGQGVDMNGVSQIRDTFLDKRFRDEYGDASYYIQSENILTDIRSAINEYGTGSALGGAIQSAYDALGALMTSPSDATAAGVVMTSFKNMTQVLRELSTKIDNVAKQQKNDLQTSLNEFNQYTERLAELNRTIRDDVAGTGGNEYYGPNELIDERNLVLDELAKFGNIDTQANKDGTVTVKMGGHTLVSGTTFDRINYSENNDGTVSILWNGNGQNCNFTTGNLKAYTDFINGRGPNVKTANESSERGIPYYKDKIDTFANTLANVYNSIIPKVQKDPNNNDQYIDIPGQYKSLFGARVPKVDADGKVIPGEYMTTTDIPITAANISLSDDWLKDSTYVIYKPDNNDTDIPMAMAQLLAGENSDVIFRSRGETFVGSFEQYVTDYTGVLGSEISFHSGRRTATSDISNDMMDRRDEVSAVSRDEETVTMMTYQKSFQAISRVMTTLDEALDVLINRTGMVGR